MSFKQAVFTILYRCVSVAAVFMTVVLCIRLLPWVLGQ